MNISELENFLSGISETLKALEMDYRGKLFPEKIASNGENTPKVSYPRFVGQVSDMPVEIDFSRNIGKKNSDPGSLFSPDLKIYLKLNATPTVLLISPESRSIIDRISKKLGLLQDIHIDDTEIDDSFIIQSDDPDQVIRFFSRQGIKSAVKKLNGFSRLEIQGSSLCFVDKPFDEERFSGDYLREVLGHLLTLAGVYSDLSSNPVE